MNQKGYKPTRKCIKYIKKMISQGSWIVNERIPTIKKISETLDISPTTARNSLRLFEVGGIIENFGSLGFFLKSKTPVINKSKSLSLVRNLKLNLEATNMFRDGAVPLKNWVVQLNKEEKKITALNIVSGIKLSCLYSVIESMIKNPITLDNLLNIQNQKIYKVKRAQYNRQQKLLPLAKLVLNHKKELFKS